MNKDITADVTSIFGNVEDVLALHITIQSSLVTNIVPRLVAFRATYNPLDTSRSGVLKLVNYNNIKNNDGNNNKNNKIVIFCFYSYLPLRHTEENIAQMEAVSSDLANIYIEVVRYNTSCRALSLFLSPPSLSSLLPPYFLPPSLTFSLPLSVVFRS